MPEARFIVAILDSSARTGRPDAAAKLRDFTIAATRFDFFGAIIEGPDVDALLREAASRPCDYCIVQSHAHVPVRFRDPHAGRFSNFFRAMAEWVAGRSFLVAGAALGADEAAGLDELCFVVDLRRYRELGMPAYAGATGAPAGGLVAAARAAGLDVPHFDSRVLGGRCDLRPESAASLAAFSGYWGEGIWAYRGPGADAALSRDQEALIEFVKDQAFYAKSGVFLGNWENYADLSALPEGFTGPASSLHSVAAGFKPNQILETHGFAADTRMVFFDYSPVALGVRRMMLEQWDGSDFPAFVERIPDHFPNAYYQIKGGERPGELDREMIRAGWQREIDIWGGAQAFQRHWRRYREIPHSFVECDLYRAPETLLATMSRSANAIAWWSNAFHSLNAVWFYARAERERIYRKWLDDLAAINPDLMLYGMDVDNLGISGTRIRDHIAAPPGNLGAAGRGPVIQVWQ